MRELIYYVAASLDGFIARKDGSFGGFPWDDTFGAHLLKTFPGATSKGASADAEETFRSRKVVGRRQLR